MSENTESIFILIALIVIIFAFYFFKEAQMNRTPRNISIVENNFHFGLSRQEQINKTVSRENLLESSMTSPSIPRRNYGTIEHELYVVPV